MERKLFVLVVAVLTSFTVRATVVDRQQAAQQAREFMAKNFKSSTRHAAQTAKLNSVETGQSLVYAFNVEGGGFVVVAGDDSAPAILGYSETSTIARGHERPLCPVPARDAGDEPCRYACRDGG